MSYNKVGCGGSVTVNATVDLNALQYSDIDDYAKKTLLDDYATPDVVDGYALTSDLSVYAEKTLLDSYALAGETGGLSYADIDDYAKKTLLDSYALAGETGGLSYADIDDYAKKTLLDSYATPDVVDGYALDSYVSSELTSINTSVITHLDDLANPHEVVAADLNALQYADIDDYATMSWVDDSYAAKSTLDAYALDSYVSSELTSINTSVITHLDDLANPHEVTAADLNALQYADIDDYAKKTLLDSYASDVQAYEVDAYSIGGADYFSVQDYIDVIGSSGIISGGVSTDGGSLELNVSAGVGVIRTSDSSTAALKFFNFDAYVETVDSDEEYHVGVDYNSGSPQVVVATSNNWTDNDIIPLSEIVTENGTIHVADYRNLVNDHVTRICNRFHDVNHIARSESDGGLILGESGDTNRYVTMSGGAVWYKLTKTTISAFNSSGADRFDRYYRDGGSGFTKEGDQQTWNNTQYDDDSGSLATLNNNRYACQWFYIETDGELVCQYGREQHVSLAAAEAESVPATAPDRLGEHGKLIGRIIFQKSDTTAQEVQSVFVTQFATGSGVVDHGLLSGLGDDDHTIYILADGTRAMSGSLDMGAQNITNVVLVDGYNLPDTFQDITNDDAYQQSELTGINTQLQTLDDYSSASDIALNTKIQTLDDYVSGELTGINTQLQTLDDYSSASEIALNTKIQTLDSYVSGELTGINTQLQTLDDYSSASDIALNTNIVTHVDNTSNPHSVTAAQLNALQHSDIDDYAKMPWVGDGYAEITHATEHQSGGGDAIKLDDLAAPDDNTDLNVSTSAHGLAPKLSNVSTEYLSGTGVFSAPAGGGGDVVLGEWYDYAGTTAIPSGGSTWKNLNGTSYTVSVAEGVTVGTDGKVTILEDGWYLFEVDIVLEQVVYNGVQFQLRKNGSSNVGAITYKIGTGWYDEFKGFHTLKWNVECEEDDYYYVVALANNASARTLTHTHIHGQVVKR